MDTEDLDVLSQVKEILNRDNKKMDFWDELTDAQKENIHLGTKQLENGEYISCEELFKKIST